MVSDKQPGLDDTIAAAMAVTNDAPIALAESFDARFAIGAELARGGMGRVVVATDATLRREVAIKELLQAEDAAAVQRFEREALITAKLQHPGITGVYDFARHGDGIAALIMRRVRGQPFDQAIGAAATMDKRLALLAPFISACDAVAYAHGEGVIHRDLKPANVLLGDFGDTVVIDWGLAKDLRDRSLAPETRAATRANETDGTLTVVGTVMGTPAYMAPEQARGEPTDARSDVYALGAMLYQLLSGGLPYEGTSSAKLLESVLAGPPRPLSALAPEVQPELITIVERAMARDAAARYANAGELASELKRFQTGQLVASHRYTMRALLARWARRHAAALTVSALALALFVIAGVIAGRRIIHERDRASAAAEASNRVVDFMTGMFKVADPTISRGATVSARSVLDSAAAKIGDQLHGEPLVKASLLVAMGGAYYNLGLYPSALALHEQALAIRTRALGDEARETLEARYLVALTLYYVEHYPQAERATRDLLASAALHKLPPSDELHLQTQLLLVNILYTEGRFDETEALARGAVELAAQRAKEGSSQMLAARALLANALSHRKSYREANQLREKNLAVATAKHDELKVAEIESDLSVDETHLGEIEAAEKHQLHGLEVQKRVYGPAHPQVLYCMVNLGDIYTAAKKYKDAEALLLSTLDLARKTLPPHAWETELARYSLGVAFLQDGQRDRALGYLTEAVDGNLPAELDLAADPRLAALHDDAAFDALVTRVEKQRRPH